MINVKVELSMKGKKKKALIEMIVIGILLLSILLLMLLQEEQPATVSDRLRAGQKCYAAGDWAGAIWHLRLYCQSEADDPDAYTLLGDSYLAHGQKELADAAYRQAARLQIPAANELNEQQRLLALGHEVDQMIVQIEPAVRYTRGMTISFFGSTENLAPAERIQGRVNRTKEALISDPGCRTTAWFPVRTEMKHLFLTGNFNCAAWQFRDAEGNIQLVDHNLDFLALATVRFSSPTYDTVEIPENAVSARVMYMDASHVNAAMDNDEIIIGYGTLPVGRSDTETYTYEIPDLLEGQYIRYEQDEWTLWDGECLKELDWISPEIHAGTLLAIDGELCGRVTVSNTEPTIPQADPMLEYGVRFDIASGMAIGQRLGAARGMRFDCVIAGEWLHGSHNDFDNAWPWCGIRRCNISVADDGSRTFIYEGEPGFALDGSAGNVMVKIPRFYVKRAVCDGFEEIWVSGYAHEGYQLEPMFIGADGQALDAVYIAAYMGAEQDERIISAAGTYPTLMLPYGQTLRMAENNGAGFSEASFLLYSALQKLFLVEVGTLDSSSVFAGDTVQCYFYDTEDVTDSCLAAEDAVHANTVTLYDNHNTQKIVAGASVALLTDWGTYRSGNAIQREVLTVSRSDGRVYVTFDGDPIDIVAGITAISGIPARTGKTDDLDYHTGTLSANDGHSSFRYRFIENLYGSALVMLDNDAYMEDGTFWYEMQNGSAVCLNASIAVQPTDLSNYRIINESCVRTMTYDAENPTVMLPATVGNGASVHTGYGDYWMWRAPSDRRYFLYGGAGDNGKAAGLFQYRAIVYSDETAHSFYSARIMYRE